MKEVTDSQEVMKIQMAIQNIPIIQDVNTLVQFRRAYQMSDGWYRVELVISQQVPLWGMLLLDQCELYLDFRSIMILVEQRIQANLDAFNAGKHWRYKGL